MTQCLFCLPMRYRSSSLQAFGLMTPWEGTIGGIILCIVAVTLLLPFLFRIHGSVFSIALAIVSAIAAITGTLGDLYESKLKRMADVKDSGSIMPGHGGFLDRFDSMLFAIPAVWLCLKLFAQ